MLRIAEFSDTFLPIVDGVGRVSYAYAETLSKMGHEVSVVCPMYDTGNRGGLPFEIVDFCSVGVPNMKQYRQGEAPMDPHYRQRMRMIPLDIIHANSPFTSGSEALRLAAIRNLPLVGTFHSKYYDDFLKATKSEALAKLGVKFVVDFFERCDEVWSVGEATASVLRDYGYKGDIIVMPNGVSIRTAKKEAIEEVQRRWGMTPQIPLFLFVGQMNWKKNIQTVLEACALLKKEGIKFKLILAGQGPDMKEIERKIYELDLGSVTSLAGHITDAELLDGLYARASLFTFPSLYDNAPMVVREAAVMGTPSLMVRGSSAADIIQENVNGYLCENSPESAAGIMKNVILNPDGAKAVGEKAKETIPVSWERLMVDVEKRFMNLVALNKAGKLKKKTIRVI